MGVCADPCKSKLRRRDTSAFGKLTDLVNQLKILGEILSSEVISIQKLQLTNEKGVMKTLIPVAENDQTCGEYRPWEYLPVS